MTGRRTKTYTVWRDREGLVRATVAYDYRSSLDGEGRSGAYALSHLLKHSPDGFEFGYAGSGPADLARSIAGDFLAMSDPDPRIYRQINAVFITPLEGDGPHEISGDEVNHIIEECCP